MPQIDYKPNLKFTPSEALRIVTTAEKQGLKPTTWMRKIIMDNAPQLEIKDPMKVRVADWDEESGWNLMHYSDVIAYMDACNTPLRDAIAARLARFLVEHEGQQWIEMDKIPGVRPGDCISPEGRAVDLVRSIFNAHIDAYLRTKGAA